MQILSVSLLKRSLTCLLFFPFSAGVGRTGVFITLSIVLERMRYEGVVDMFQTVKMLRTQRPAMVQTEVCIVKLTKLKLWYWKEYNTIFKNICILRALL